MSESGKEPNRWMVSPHLTRKAKVAGIGVDDMMILMLLAAGLATVAFIGISVGLPGGILYPAVAVAVVAMYVVLRFANATGHPSYLTSLISFQLKQPKTIDLGDGQIPRRQRAV